MSSPGPERPLRKPEHFEARDSGGTSPCAPSRKIEGRNRFKGELVEAGDGAVVLSPAGELRAATHPVRRDRAGEIIDTA